MPSAQVQNESARESLVLSLSHPSPPGHLPARIEGLYKLAASQYYSASNGAPITDRPYEAQRCAGPSVDFIELLTSAHRVGRNGPLLLQDFHREFPSLVCSSPTAGPLLGIRTATDLQLADIDLLAHFDRERVPERVVQYASASRPNVESLTPPQRKGRRRSRHLRSDR